MNLFGEAEVKEYQVLARKYRPKKLSELVGQDVLVKTVANAIEMNKIPHAFVLTGIRGVGKTSTARIIARSLLCLGEDGKNTKPTKEPCGVCNNCVSISQDRNVDVIEVDAASRTGVDDIREIIDQVVYAPVQGRYKIFIIDEVHMLSKNAFNALLKTLEEPPHHVKFIFATTEIRKIPVTILSRCMRFDLPRVSADVLVRHFSNIANAENAKVADEALMLIAKASEGSVRDGLSLLDQSISISNNGNVEAETVRNMLGLADKEKTLELFKNIVSGKTDESLKIIRELYRLGVEPVIALQDLLEVTHFVTQVKISKDFLELGFSSESEKKFALEYSDKVEISYLSRLWQLLSKGISEAKFVANSLISAEMIIIRICYGATMPTPEQILSKLDLSSTNTQDNKKSFDTKAVELLEAQKKTLIEAKNILKPVLNPEKQQFLEVDKFSHKHEPALENNNVLSEESDKPTTQELQNQDNETFSNYFSENPAAELEDQPIPHNLHVISTEIYEPLPVQNELMPSNFLELVELFKKQGEHFTATFLEDVTPIAFDKAIRKIEFAPSNLTPKNLVSEVSEKLFKWTGERWFVTLNNISKTEGETRTSLRTEKEITLEKRKNEALEHELVKEILELFPNSKVISTEENFEETKLPEQKINTN